MTLWGWGYKNLGNDVSEPEVWHWLGHVLEEGVSQSCLSRNPFVGVIVQHLLEGEIQAYFRDVKKVDQAGHTAVPLP